MTFEPIDALIERSSFGTEGARRLRSRTPMILVRNLLLAADAFTHSIKDTRGNSAGRHIRKEALKRRSPHLQLKKETRDMIESVQGAFEQFERNVVRVPSQDNDAAKRVLQEVRDHLARELAELVETFLSGSYSRRVQVVRLHDIDIIAVLDDPTGAFAASAAAALEAIGNAARSCDLVSGVSSPRVRSVRLTLHDYEFTIDLVGAREPEDGADGLLLARHLPEEERDDWTWGNPRGQRQAAIDKNEETGGTYVPSVRLVKYWLGRVWGDGDKPLRSYHAESILHGALSKKVDFDQAMVLFFDAAYDALAPGVLTPDPGAPSTYVDERLDANDRREARDAVDFARTAAHAAYEKEDLGEALDAWAEIFGPAFPAPGTSPEKVGASLAAGTAGVVGAGIQAGRGRPVIQSRPWREQ